ncbi:MAG: branched-chain amino acid ABC transporter permease [Desulfobacterota bacterium]|nr:branched-chain amino acid ABC transporter permease [Thermodesulfobacteriota bacterium]
MSYLFQSLFNGLLAGCIYALFAMGLTMVYRVLNFVNFAHGELIMWGAYFLYLFMGSPFYFPLYVALLPALGSTMLLGLGMDRVAFQPLRQANRLTLLIAALGLSFFLRNGAQLFWGAELRTYGFEIQRGWKIFHIRITANQMAIILTTLACILMVYLLLYRSKIGKSMRAVSDNLELARVTGIDVKKTIQFTWIISSALACVGGILLALDTNLQPGMGMINLVKAFAAILLGGVGKVWGALWGGIFIGLAENLGVLFISTGYKDSIAFGIMVLLLLLKPSTLGVDQE